MRQVVIGPAAQEKSFPLRSVPETLNVAAEESFKSLSEEGGSQTDLVEVQKKLREAAQSFCPAEGAAPEDAPQASRGRGRGRGKGRGRGRGRANKKAKLSDDGDDANEEDGGSDADLDKEDEKLKDELSEPEEPAAPGKEATPGKGKEATPKRKPAARKRHPKTPTGKTPPRKRRTTPKLKRAIRATHAGDLDTSLQIFYW
eukprot:s2779_g2.t1